MTQYALVATRVARNIDRLSDADLAVLRLCDGVRTVDDVCRASRAPRGGVLSLLRRAERAGMVVPATRLPLRGPLPPALAHWLATDETLGGADGFSEAELEFFARPVEAEEPWSNELAV